MPEPVSAVRVLRILGPVFAAVGGLLGCIGLVSALSRAVFLQDASTADGQVTSVEEGVPSVQVTLPRGPRTIQGVISSNPPSFVVGERVPVYFRKSTGEDAVIGSFFELWFLPVVFGAIATPFAALGAGFMVSVARRRRRDSELRARGRKLQAKIVAVQLSALRINRRPAKILVAEARDASGQSWSFRSDALLLEEPDWIGREVTVYVDPLDSRRYVFEFPG